MRLQSLLGALLCVCVASCGGGGPCTVIGLNVTPKNSTANHSAASPGNAIQFFATTVVPSGCVNTANASDAQSLPRVTWSVSDPVNVSISNTLDGTAGTATCLNATAGAITVTASFPPSPTQSKQVAGTAKLTCN